MIRGKMIMKKGTIFFIAAVLLAFAIASSAYGAYLAPIEYRQTMTVIMRDTDVNDWLPTYARHFEEIVTSAGSTNIAFLVRLDGYKDRRLYLADYDGRNLTDLSSHLPPGININNVYNLRFSGDGSRLFFFGNYGADVIYCDVLTVNHSCSTAFAGPIYGDGREPFSVDNHGTKLYFKHDTGWDDVAKKYRRGLFWASVGYSLPVELMNIDRLPGSQNTNLLRYLGSSEQGTLLFTWLNTDSPAPAQTSMYKVGLDSGLSLMPDEKRQYVWDAQDLRNRLIDFNGYSALYASGTYGQPQELYLLYLWYGTKELILKTTDGNGFHGGPALSPTGSIALVKTIGYNQTRINLHGMSTRDTSSHWFGEAGCSGGELVSDITGTDRYYYLGSACGSGDPAKIFRVDMKPGGWAQAQAPHIAAITFNSRYLPFDDTATLTITAKVREATLTHKAVEWVKMISLVDGREAPEWLIADPLTYDTALYDDGTHGDAEAGDGIYTNNAIRSNSSSNFYTRYMLPHYVGIRVVAKDVDDNYVMADTKITVSEDPLPTVWISFTSPNAAEPGSPGWFIVSRKGTDSTEDSLTVKYSVSGSAIAGKDYVALSGSVTINAGSLTAPIIITPKDDYLMEGTETVTVTLSPDAAYTVGKPASDTVNIISDEVVTVSATDDRATEAGRTTGTFKVRRTGFKGSDLIVNYSVSGTATPGSDYEALSGVITIPAGSYTAPITVTPVNDTAAEGAETVKVTLSPRTRYKIGTPGSATVNIISNE
jgi:hypothetical protein